MQYIYHEYKPHNGAYTWAGFGAKETDGLRTGDKERVGR